MNRVSERLHVWIGKEMSNKIKDEAEEMNTTKSELLRIVLTRHYRDRGRRHKRYAEKHYVDKYASESLKISLPTTLYNDINKYCNKHGYTRSHLIRKACMEFLRKEDNE